MSTLNLLLLVLTVVSGLYWLSTLACVRAFGLRRPGLSAFAPPVTVLKPLWGDDGRLYENLRSFCVQEYPRHQVIFGVRDPGDPAVPIVERLIAEFPHLDLSLVVSDRLIGTNHKVSNLSNLCQQAKYDTLVVADSDMRVGPEYLRAVVAPLEDPSVGLVTCLYKGVAANGLPSVLGAMFINEWFFPSALVAARLEPLRHAFGATMACRRDTLASVGGFEALADYLADDYMLGWLISRRRLGVVLAPYVVENVVVEKDVRSLFFHELRWTRTVRTVRPVSYFFSAVTYGIPLSLVFLLSSGRSRLALAALATHLALRCGGRVLLYRTLRLPASWREAWLVPVRDLLSFILWAASFLGQSVRWNGDRFRVHADGRLRADVGGAAALPVDDATEPAPAGHK